VGVMVVIWQWYKGDSKFGGLGEVFRLFPVSHCESSLVSKYIKDCGMV